MYLGIDIGTSSVKVVALDDRDVVVEQASAPLTVSRPYNGWSEQNPSDWWRATQDAVSGISARVRRNVQAIGLSGQMHGATLLDAADRPLRPAILWNDGRSAAQCAVLERQEPASRRITGNIAMPGFTAPKLMWLREHEPEVYNQIAHILLPKDYVRLKMSGTYATEVAGGSGIALMDIASRTWSDEMLAAFDFPTGTLHPNAANDGPYGVWTCFPIPLSEYEGNANLTKPTNPNVPPGI